MSFQTKTSIKIIYQLACQRSSPSFKNNTNNSLIFQKKKNTSKAYHQKTGSIFENLNLGNTN